jgi:hypothetical protein
MAVPRGFTDAYLRHLKPRSERYDVTDPARTGLQLRVYPTGKKSFQYRYHFEGQARRLTIGPYPQLSLSEAHWTHTEAERLLARGIDPARQKATAEQEAHGAGTVAELAEEFLTRYLEVHRKRPDQARRMLEADVLPRWGSRKAKDNWIRQFQQFGAPPVTVYRELRRLVRSPHPEIELARLAADQGNWHAFTRSVSQSTLEGSSWILRPYRVWSDRPGRYGDPLGLVLKGIRSQLNVELSRFREWTIRWCASNGNSSRLH